MKGLEGINPDTTPESARSTPMRDPYCGSKSTAGPWACDGFNPNGAAATRGALPAEAQNATQGLVAFEMDTDRSRAMNRLACPDQIARALVDRENGQRI